MSKAFFSLTPCLSRAIDDAEGINRVNGSTKSEETAETPFSAASLCTVPLKQEVDDAAAHIARP